MPNNCFITTTRDDMMKWNTFKIFNSIALCLMVASPSLSAQENEKAPLRVTVDNFKRAETDLYFAKFAKEGAFGKFFHNRELIPVEKQDVIRMNRDTLYSTAIADLEHGPVTLDIPNSNGRFLSIQVINEDHYTPMVIYKAGKHRITKKDIGTRYVLFLVRTFVDPNSQADLKAVHELQDQFKIQQAAESNFEVPNWDVVAAEQLRVALNALVAANGGVDSSKMFGAEGKVDPVHHLLGTASGWGGNPLEDAYYVGGEPTNNDGKTIYQLTVKDVPVKGFWSISIYNKAGFFEKNKLGLYTLNNITAKKDNDGSVTIQFGNCENYKGNCLPITSGWNYLVRLYRPEASILNGKWTFPKPTQVK